MTAEIAVLNRNAVALAADSAVTLQFPEGPKIFHTNKLFSLSKYRPVGIMIYGSADLMEVPWETIIKQYRSKLGQRGFARLEEYATSFLTFLERNSGCFPKSAQRAGCDRLVRYWLRRLKIRLRNAVEKKLKAKGQVSEQAIRTMFGEIVRDDISHLRRHKKLPRFTRVSHSSLLRRYHSVFGAAINDELQKLVGAIPTKQLEKGCVLAITRDLYWAAESGIVIAGFGNAEHFPNLRCYKLDSMIAGKLRAVEFREKRCEITNTDVSAGVFPFAQSEMVSLFMEGIDTDYAAFIGAFVSHSFLKGYPSMLVKILSKHITPALQKNIEKQLSKVGRKLTAELDSDLKQYSRTRHSLPILEIVNSLPKEELAAMAEALVNLTSFKRHVTKEAETVGGPIDVAVISRGDGFIWIKRKHYFTKDLNPHFLANYYYNEKKLV